MDSESSDKTVAGINGETKGLPKQIGEYKIHRRIARGGMSYVYAATSSVDQSQVALKVLDAQLADQSSMQQRFRREAHAIQLLDHENIVPLHGFGSDDGTLYLAMKLIDGVTVTNLIQHLRREMNRDTADTPSTAIDIPDSEAKNEADAAECASKVLVSDSHFRDIAKLVAVAAEAVHDAHEHRIIHRDIKPSNLMIDRDGKLWLTDFGLASNDDGQTVVTHTGELIGTPHYMSPEQASADHDGYDYRTDIYSLGATLYELATLTRPYRGERFRVLMEISTGRLTAPTRVRPDVPVAMEAIILKAMAYSPGDRYQSGAEMSDDLGRFVRGETTAARLPSAADRAVRWLVRNPRKSVFTLLAIASVATLVMTLQYVGGRRLQKSRELLQRHLYVADVAAGFRAYALRDIDAVDQLLTRHRPNSLAADAVGFTGGDLRGFEWRLLNNLCQQPDVTLLGMHGVSALDTKEHAATEVAMIPRSQECLSVGSDGYARRWNLRENQQTQEFFIAPDLDAIAISPDGKSFVTSQNTGTHINPTAIRDLATGSVLHELTPHEHSVESACFSPDGKFVATACRYQVLMLHRTDGSLQKHRDIGSRNESLAFAPDGKHLLAIVRPESGSQSLQKLSLSDLQTVEKLKTTFSPNVFAVSDDGNRVVVADGTSLALHRWPDMQELLAAQRLRGRVRCVALNHDGSRIYAGCDNGSLNIWELGLQKDLPSPPLPVVISTGDQPVTSIVIDGDDRALVTTGSGAVQLWQTARLTALPKKLHRTVKTAVIPTADAREAIVRFRDGSVGKLDFDTLEFRTLTEVTPDEHLQLAVSPDQQILAVSTPEQIIGINVSTGQPIASVDIGVKNDPSDGLSFTRDGEHLIHLLNDRFQVLRVGPHADDWSHEREIMLGSDGVNGLTVSPLTGEIIISVSGVSMLRIYEDKTFKLLKSIPCQFGNFNAYCYSQSGKRIALGYGDGTVEVRDANFNRLVLLKGHRSNVNHCTFIEDEKKLITCSDRQIRFWDIDSGRELGVLSVDDGVRLIHYSLEQDSLYAFPYNKPVQVWPAHD
ncbi:MAG: protein kinase domain-containing protein [Rubripirellula sp.]